MITVGVALFGGAEELDWAGPWEVFGMWSGLHPDEARTISLSEEPGIIASAKGLRVVADHAYEQAPRFDVLVYPEAEEPRLSWMTHDCTTVFEDGLRTGS